jgi:hypothetical protein
MFLTSIFNCIFMIISSYFFSGDNAIDFSFNGIFGLFTSIQFSGFFYMSIVIGMGTFISDVLLVRLFEPIVPATSAIFEPIISILIIHFMGA